MAGRSDRALNIYDGSREQWCEMEAEKVMVEHVAAFAFNDFVSHMHRTFMSVASERLRDLVMRNSEVVR